MIEDDLGKIVNNIWSLYEYLCDQWDDYYTGHRYNLKKKQVKDIINDIELYYEILSYRNLLSSNMPRLIRALTAKEQLENIRVSSRVKVQNSVESKVIRYLGRREKGNIPINKCINDLFGIRVIVPTEYTCQEIATNLKLQLTDNKVINSTKMAYKAVHVYFSHGNQYFPWEFQIWKASDEENNYISHKEYKQDYTAWEKTSEEGE